MDEGWPGEILLKGEAQLDAWASRSGCLLEGELEQGLVGIATAGQVLARARLRLASEVAGRGLHLGSGFSLVDWLGQRCPDLSGQEVRDLARVASAAREPVHAPLVQAVLAGDVPVARAAVLHRCLARVKPALAPQKYQEAVALLVGAGCTPGFEERDITRITSALLAACLPERDHDARTRARRELRDVHESGLADGTVRRIVVTFGDDADYQAVRALLLSPLAAPASREEQDATGVIESRTAGQRRYDALMTVLRRGIAGTHGQPSTPKATLVVTLDYDTLARDVEDSRTLPGCGATLDGAPVTAATIRRVACEADLIPMVLAGPTEIVDQGRRHRLVTPGQRLRLAARDRGCTIPGCTVTATWCDAHHVIPWSRGGRSDLSNYALLCPRHHTWVHEQDHPATVTSLGVIWRFQR